MFLLILTISGVQEFVERDWVHGFQHLLLATGLSAAVGDGPGTRQASSLGRLRHAAGVGAIVAASILLLYRVARIVFHW